MRSVRSIGTGAERKCEKILRTLGIRFHENSNRLPGRPDFVLSEVGVALFVHGCFWHSHRGCKRSALPKSNRDYWEEKMARNRRRDRRVRDKLRRSGWRTAVIWECKLGDTASVSRRLAKLCQPVSRGKKLG